MQSEPGHSGRDITQTALAKQMRCRRRTVIRALAAVKAAAPELYERADIQRKLRAQINRTYDVRL